MRERIRWDAKKVAKLGVLIGACWPPSLIAKHPDIRASENAVRLKARALGLEFQPSPGYVVEQEVVDVFDVEAKRYHITGKSLLREFFRACMDQPHYIHNFCDLEGG